MLVLTRKLHERILIDDEIAITVCRIEGDKVRIGIEAPQHVHIRREELVTQWAGDSPDRSGWSKYRLDPHGAVT